MLCKRQLGGKSFFQIYLTGVCQDFRAIRAATENLGTPQSPLDVF